MTTTKTIMYNVNPFVVPFNYGIPLCGNASTVKEFGSVQPYSVLRVV